MKMISKVCKTKTEREGVGGDLWCNGSKEWISTGERELTDEGLTTSQGGDRTERAGDTSAMATLMKGITIRGQGIRDTDRQINR